VFQLKKSIIILGLSTMAALSGCSGANEASDRDIYEESGNTINVNDSRSELYNENNGKNRNKSEDFGYVRHQKAPMGENMSNDHYSAVDREQLANIISKLSTDLPNVNDVATLVTDEEVLIAYDTDTKDRNLTADQVKKTALSVVPRYFHVYVTDNKNLIKNVESYANLDSDTPNIDSMVDKLIAKMKDSPQGNKVNSKENENGETAEDM
jgi:hypothetical protein